ncbi:MAG TPA: TetR/AcrR family transcriptional regulator [Acidimicrobiales bacterium]|nr:TetR/AcrR family transcriptional regulator [Acidimicrobiales bacterium]
MAKEGGEAYKARRKLIIETAAQVFKDKGYESASINDIAQQLDTDRASLYYYAASKEELLNEVVNIVLDENLKVAKRISATSGNPRQRLTALIEDMISSYDRNYPFMYVYIQDMTRIAEQNVPWAKETVTKTKKFESMIRTMLRDGQASGHFRKDVPLILADFSLFGMINWTHTWYKPGGKSSPKEVANAFCTIFFDGFATKNAK